MLGQHPSRNRTHTLVRYLTIVPKAHYAVFDADLQMTLYELFHTHRISRVGHAVCTPIVCFSALAALAQVRLPSPLDAPYLSPALPLAALLGAYAYLHGRRIGALTTAVMAMMTLAASLYAAAGMLATTAFIALELLASFRVLPCQLRIYALALGSTPSERIALDRRVAELRAARLV